MADFLSDPWFEALNETLAHAGPVPVKRDTVFRIVIEMTDAPGGAPHALTLTIQDRVAKVDPGDNLLADTLIGMSFSDAKSLFRGDTDSASALREGKVKVRGNINALVPLLEWLQNAHPLGGGTSVGEEDA
ncbi:MAG: SCP2 sterol-binding domain-containing protein [Acidimicrobiales bacterium]